MNTKMAAQVIRDQVKMDDVLALYGYRPRHGFLCCPFHGEKAPSLKIYPDTGGWHCFGCGRGGSVIDFVMEHENCDFRAAVTAIDNALHLNLMDPNENPFEAARRRQWQLALDNFVAGIIEICDRMIRYIECEQKLRLSFVKGIEAKAKQEITAKEWDVIHTWAEDDQYDEYRKDKINDLKEEVAAWRRKARRTG